LVAQEVSKAYAGVPVLSQVGLELASGEIHALVGENGAGKSTFLKILTGAVTADQGRVTLEGTDVPSGNPQAARRRGISVVYQEFTLVPDLTVADNIFLGRELGGVVLSRAEMDRQAGQILETLGVTVSPKARVRGLSVAHQQLVEIARALVTDAKVLILDEPSATLSGQDVDRLFEVLRRLRGRGLGIVYVSHRLEEIFQLADRVTVLRDGRRVSTCPVSETTRQQIIRDMVGRDVSEEYPARTSAPGATVLEARRLEALPRMADVSLSVRRGEIVGLAGLVGAGRTSTALAMVGRLRHRGEVYLSGRPVSFRSPHDAIAEGLAYVTEDRKGAGIFPVMGVDENITMTHLAIFARAGVLAEGRRRQSAAMAAKEMDVRCARLAQPIATLSGGNQQKALLARYLLKTPLALILDEPTRGVDVGARSEIYGIMNRLTAAGLGILMISSDLPEILGMSDRVVVMKEGRVTGEFSRAAATPEAVMAAATAAHA
jgi:ribose transport system ATP-binding protein